MHPNAEKKFRNQTHAEAGSFNLTTHVCSLCKKTRSRMQFQLNPEVCRTCLTGK